MRMEALRNGQKDEWIGTAARAWINWQRRHRNDDRGPSEQRAWVADVVNEKHGTGFKRNWVSTNLEEILERVEALKDAKG